MENRVIGEVVRGDKPFDNREGEKMDNRVLLIWEKSAFFFSRSVREKLLEHKIEVETVDAGVTAVSGGIKKAALLVFYVSEQASLNSGLLNYLSEQCQSQQKGIVLVGYDDDINRVRETLPARYIVGQYSRPINVGELCEGIRHELEIGGTKKELPHILVVDDSPQMLRMIKGWFQDGYKVSMANSAQMAFGLLAKQRPDIILLDYEMPGCSGGEMLGQLKADPQLSTIPVIFLTGKNDAQTVHNVLALRPSGYLLKTMPPDQIVANVEQMLFKR